MNKNNYCVIMAGGIGSRFWPLSRTSKPKQFLDILGIGQTFLQMTFNRFKAVIPTENIYIVTNSIYKELVYAQLPEISRENVLLEPMRKNTAPCIIYANYKIKNINENANIVVAPSDHLIIKESEFLDVVNRGLEFVANYDALLTLGIKPSRPETGYGYIQADKNNAASNNYKDFSKVKTFTEKPDLDLAKVFYESGEFFWNAGIFFWSLTSIMNATKLHLPDVNSLFAEGFEAYNTPDEHDFIMNTYPKCKNISIDYGVMEKADNVFVLCSDFGWSDLGTWGSLYEHLTKDDDGNSIQGENVFSYNLQDCIVKMPKEKLVVLEGLKDYIVVESDNILLVCQKQNEQRIKQFVNDVKIKKGDDYL